MLNLKDTGVNQVNLLPIKPHVHNEWGDVKRWTL